MKWFILMLSLPIFELIVFFKINEIIGMTFTVTIIIMTGLIGGLIVRAQALDVFHAFQDHNKNILLLISHGLILVIAGLILLLPGFITDIIGFLLLIPNLRALIINEITKKLTKV